jgi:hypothetical protein
MTIKVQHARRRLAHVSAPARLTSLFGIDMPDDVKLETVALIQAAQSVLTWILHTYFQETK